MHKGKGSKDSLLFNSTSSLSAQFSLGHRQWLDVRIDGTSGDLVQREETSCQHSHGGTDLKNSDARSIFLDLLLIIEINKLLPSCPSEDRFLNVDFLVFLSLSFFLSFPRRDSTTKNRLIFDSRLTRIECPAQKEKLLFTPSGDECLLARLSDQYDA